MMQTFQLLVKLRTALLVGGQSSSLLSDCSTARLSSGEPIIPASALKGALRMEFERLARAKKLRACNSALAEESCGNSENPCFACTLFGSPGLEGKLRFFDAHPQKKSATLFVKEEGNRSKPTGYGFGIRTSVSISRKRKTAAEKMLYHVETVAPFIPECCFEAKVESREKITDEESLYLRAAASSLQAIGRGKSRGIGRVEVYFEECKPDGDTGTVLTPTNEGALILDLIPQENLMISGIKTKDNFMDGLGYIPGSHVRGAVAHHFIRFLNGGAADTAFNEAFFKRPALFPDFYPTVQSVPSKPIPLTLRTCKHFPGIKVVTEAGEESHGARDILLDYTAVKLLRENKIDLVLNDRCTLRNCNAPMVNLPGYYTTGMPAASKAMHSTSQIITKTAINRRRWQSVEGKLYTYQLIDFASDLPENARPHYLGTVVDLTPELELCLKQLHGKMLYIGAARSRGLGAVKVEVKTENGSSMEVAEKESADSFTAYIREVLKKFGLTKLRGNSLESLQFFSLTLLSDLVLPPGNCKEVLRTAVSGCLGLDKDVLCLESAVTATGYRGGYSDILGIRKELVAVIRAGSAFVFSCPVNLWPVNAEINKGVAKLLRQGFGLLREEGFGRASFCDEVHLWRTTQA